MTEQRRLRRYCKHCHEKTWHTFKFIANGKMIAFTCEDCIELEIVDVKRTEEL
jgi:hypothetical protein